MSRENFKYEKLAIFSLIWKLDSIEIETELFIVVELRVWIHWNSILVESFEIQFLAIS